MGRIPPARLADLLEKMIGWNLDSTFSGVKGLQTPIQVLTSYKRSLRDAIVNDKRLKAFDLDVAIQKKAGRPHGWAKLHSRAPEAHGAINVEWSGPTRMLTCRVVTRGEGRPDRIIADFVKYLLSRYRNKIEAINILPR